MVTKYLKNNKGFTVIYTIILMAVIFPLILFVSIDLPYYMTMNRKIKNTLDNATSTAITCINEQQASSGKLQIIEGDAKNTVNNIISQSFSLDKDLTPNKTSVIKDKPVIQVRVINNPSLNEFITTQNGQFKVKNPSVAVYGEIPVRGKFFNMFCPKIKYTAISQVQFK